MDASINAVSSYITVRMMLHNSENDCEEDEGAEMNVDGASGEMQE